MAGSKRAKVKKLFSPSPSTTPDESAVPDDDLMDDLFSQLDSKDETVQQESANVLSEMQDNRDVSVGSVPSVDSDSSKKHKSSKERHKARQVGVRDDTLL